LVALEDAEMSKRKQLGNLTAYQIHEIRRGRLDVYLPAVADHAPWLVHGFDSRAIEGGIASVSAYIGGRGSTVFYERVPLSTMVEVR
jgi:hypothetical protein